jgi:hypothetical protein
MNTIAHWIRPVVRSDHETFVVSAEVLTWPQGSWSHLPPIERIGRVIALLDPSGTRTKIVFGVRPQADWLASFYAQVSPRSNFQAFVRSWLNRRDDDPNNILNFSGLDDQFSSIVGAENVSLLPLHEFGTPSFWSLLTERTTLDARAFAAWHASSPEPMNTANRGGEWTTRGGQGLRGQLARDMPAGSLASRLIKSRWNIPLRLLTPITRTKAHTFRMDEALRDEIDSRYLGSNARMARNRGIVFENKA